MIIALLFLSFVLQNYILVVVFAIFKKEYNKTQVFCIGVGSKRLYI